MLNETMTWNTFLAGQDTFCTSARHMDMQIPASMFEMLWFRDTENIAQSRVILGWFSCSDCHTEMFESWKEGP